LGFLRSNRNLVPAVGIAGVIGLIGLGLTGGPRLAAYLVLHPPTRTTGATPSGSPGVDYQQVSFTTSDGLILRGWHLPRHSGATVVLVHGYARDRSELLPEAEWLVENGYSALVFDMRAQGSSDGTYVGMGFLEARDVQAAIDFVLNQSPQERIGVMGYSMGAVSAIQAATEDERIQAVIAVSPFATLRDTVFYRLERLGHLGHLIVWWGERMTGFRMGTLRPVDTVSALAPRPILLMQAGDDGFIPQNSGQRLYEAAGKPKELWFVEGVKHVDFRQAVPDQYKQRVLGFFERHLPLDD
jgi:alpha-beta hydrolase superfamily lysophospholipase